MARTKNGDFVGIGGELRPLVEHDLRQDETHRLFLLMTKPRNPLAKQRLEALPFAAEFAAKRDLDWREPLGFDLLFGGPCRFEQAFVLFFEPAASNRDIDRARDEREEQDRPFRHARKQQQDDERAQDDQGYLRHRAKLAEDLNAELSIRARSGDNDAGGNG